MGEINPEKSEFPFQSHCGHSLGLGSTDQERNNGKNRKTMSDKDVIDLRSDSSSDEDDEDSANTNNANSNRNNNRYYGLAERGLSLRDPTTTSTDTNPSVASAPNSVTRMQPEGSAQTTGQNPDQPAVRPTCTNVRRTPPLTTDEKEVVEEESTAPLWVGGSASSMELPSIQPSEATGQNLDQTTRKEERKPTKPVMRPPFTKGRRTPAPVTHRGKQVARKTVGPHRSEFSSEDEIIVPLDNIRKTKSPTIQAQAMRQETKTARNQASGLMAPRKPAKLKDPPPAASTSSTPTTKSSRKRKGTPRISTGGRAPRPKSPPVVFTTTTRPEGDDMDTDANGSNADTNNDSSSSTDSSSSNDSTSDTAGQEKSNDNNTTTKSEDNSNRDKNVQPATISSLVPPVTVSSFVPPVMVSSTGNALVQTRRSGMQESKEHNSSESNKEDKKMPARASGVAQARTTRSNTTLAEQTLRQLVTFLTTPPNGPSALEDLLQQAM